MKLLLENWRKFTESSEDPELWGNCGMVAVAIAEEAKSRGLDPMLVLVHNADDEDTIIMGDYDLYHVAVTIGDDYYDDRGKISRDELNFDDFGEEDRDYYVDEFFLNEKVKDAIKRNTNWDKCPADFKERALEILDNETPPKESEVGYYDPDLGRYQMNKAPWQRVSSLISDIVMSMRRGGEELPSQEELFNMVDHEPYTSYEEYKDARKKDMEGYANWFRGQRGWSK